MQNSKLDQLILKDHQLFFEDAFGERQLLPNLTNLWRLYHDTQNQAVKANILPIFKEELGTLLVAEIMIDATHEVTIKRLETGEIQKNMKHVHDYYIIPKSHYALAHQQFEQFHHSDAASTSFESCHFMMFPFGLAIIKAAFPEYTNLYTSTSCLTALLGCKA